MITRFSCDTIAMMQSKNDEYSYFLLREKEVDSVAEAYFCTRAVDEEDDQNYDSSSCFDDSSDNETDEESQNGVASNSLKLDSNLEDRGFRDLCNPLTNLFVVGSVVERETFRP